MITTLLKEKVCLDFCELTFTEDFILIIDFNKGIEIEKMHVMALWQIGKELYIKTGARHKVLTIVGTGTTITKEAREFGSSKEVDSYGFASAILINNLAHKIIGNFMVRAKKQHVPVKLFTNKELAISWLNTFTDLRKEIELDEELDNNKSFLNLN